MRTVAVTLLAIVLLAAAFVGGWVAHAQTQEKCYTIPATPAGPGPYSPGRPAHLECR